MIGLTITCFDSEVLVQRLSQRLELCRQEGCFNACWAMQGGLFRVRTFEGNYCDIVFKPPVVIDGQDPVLLVEWALENVKRMSRIVDPLQDSVQFEEIFMHFHHLNFGLCSLKNNRATSPINRLEKVEAIVEDLLRLVQPDDGKRVKL